MQSGVSEQQASLGYYRPNLCGNHPGSLVDYDTGSYAFPLVRNHTQIRPERGHQVKLPAQLNRDYLSWNLCFAANARFGTLPGPPAQNDSR